MESRNSDLPEWLNASPQVAPAAASAPVDVETAQRIRSLQTENAELHVVLDALSAINTMMTESEPSEIYAHVLRGIVGGTGASRVILAAIAESSMQVVAEVTRGEGIRYRESVVVAPLTQKLEASIASRTHYTLRAGEDRAFEDVLGVGVEIVLCALPIAVQGVVVAYAFAVDPPADGFSDFALYLATTWTARTGDALGRIGMEAQLKAMLDESKALATTDLLTGLPNRRGFTVALEHELSRAARNQDSFAFMLFDLDGFKQINDTQGHDAGDEALRRFADTLTQAKRTVDLAARFAGDEFVVLLHAIDRGQTEIALERFYEMIHAVGLRSSCGVAIYPQAGRTADALYHAADEALYASKRAGKDRFTFAGPATT